MSATFFFASAVCAGFVLIGLVAYTTLWPRPEHRPSITALLGLLGFALIASPNWTSISIRGEGLELSLLREMQARQLEALAGLQAEACAEPAALPEPARAALGAPAPASHPGKRAPEPSGARPQPPAEAEPPAPLSRERAQRLVDAFERGELPLRALSNRELLTLNERLSERARASLRP